MSTHYELQILKTALAECEKKISQTPNFQPLLSIEKQIQYLIDLTENKTHDHSRLKDIMIGVYAVREFEDRDMEFANLLYEVEEVVDLLKKRRGT
jgi:Tsi6